MCWSPQSLCSPRAVTPVHDQLMHSASVTASQSFVRRMSAPAGVSVTPSWLMSVWCQLGSAVCVFTCCAACCRVQGVLDPSAGQLSLTLDLHDAAADVPGRVASFLQVKKRPAADMFTCAHLELLLPLSYKRNCCATLLCCSLALLLLACKCTRAPNTSSHVKRPGPSARCHVTAMCMQLTPCSVVPCAASTSTDMNNLLLC